MKSSKFVPVAACLAFAACAPAVQQPVATAPSTSVSSLPASNPFAAQSTLPYQTPDFSKIHNSDYEPAFNAGMSQQIAEIEVIANNPAAPTFDNTIVELEQSGALLTRVAKVFNALPAPTRTIRFSTFRKSSRRSLRRTPMRSSSTDKLYQRVKRLYDKRDALGYDARSKALVETTTRTSSAPVRNLSESDKAKLRELNKEESTAHDGIPEQASRRHKGGALVIDNDKRARGLQRR